MTEDYGPQYSREHEFKARARLHQSRFRVHNLHADYFEYGNCLSEEDALEGKNFYTAFEGLFDEVKKRYFPKYNRLYRDMLRSEHIPFNFFIPLKFEPELAKDIFNELIGNKIARIKKVEIEYFPEPRAAYLNDRTAFNTYIEFVHTDGKPGFLGIEVKYTEQDYPYGKKEFSEINNPNSEYNLLTRRCGIFNTKTLKTLRQPRYKQVWRNQLLGEKMLEVLPEFKHFISILLYPSGNRHFANVSREYKDKLKGSHKDRFFGITFEEFIDAGFRHASGERIMDWLKYLRERYIVR
ncbi:MAG: hypothetical protein JW712_00215 [Dehalococcoidales bacterium]|nr:hypothetical protein [Dehalococcoidales bacterium]